MKRSRFSEEQIIAILKEQENGLPTKDVCRRHGISTATFYKWKAKYGGLDVSDARKLKALELENNKFKKLLAEQMLDNAICPIPDDHIAPSRSALFLARSVLKGI